MKITILYVVTILFLLTTISVNAQSGRSLWRQEASASSTVTAIDGINPQTSIIVIYRESILDKSKICNGKPPTLNGGTQIESVRMFDNGIRLSGAAQHFWAKAACELLPSKSVYVKVAGYTQYQRRDKTSDEISVQTGFIIDKNKKDLEVAVSYISSAGTDVINPIVEVGRRFEFKRDISVRIFSRAELLIPAAHGEWKTGFNGFIGGTVRKQFDNGLYLQQQVQWVGQTETFGLPGGSGVGMKSEFGKTIGKTSSVFARLGTFSRVNGLDPERKNLGYNVTVGVSY